MTTYLHDVLEHLSPEQARDILTELADKDEELAARITGMAIKLLRQIDTQEIADSVAATIFAEETVVVWKEGAPSDADLLELRTFVDSELGTWGARLLREP